MSKTSQVILQVIVTLAAMITTGVWLKENIWAYPADNIYSGQNLFVLRYWFDSRVIHHVHAKEKLVALTFDDGPDPRYTPQVLDILKQHRVHATFFVVGESVQRHPDIVKRELQEGHEIENHSYTHPDLGKKNAAEILKELETTQKVIEITAGRAPRYFRPPRGLFNTQVVEIAQRLGMKTVLWDIGVEHRAFRDPRDMAYRVVGKAHPGIIILAHDGRLDRSLTVKALPILINEYQKMGYRFVTLTELLASAETSP
ncbi:MAG: polysaccharide deacetylase family protein [Syntrophothermus sp.]|uniref:polysaccharide deacetylase family protein n=1 Tax=Syntrophothermus sp. TaxID=2736299 RepID=UPI0025807C95|nr:polysaccharide deacetylase family protein [Syntrophothermus sp.]NSW81931.1 polysaccharide deacetylase family protein [Syntrophothermus sp.]